MTTWLPRELALEPTIRGSLVLLCAIGLAALNRRWSAALRHRILVLAVAVAALTPQLLLGLPAVFVRILAPIGPPSSPGVMIEAPPIASEDSQWEWALRAGQAIALSILAWDLARAHHLRRRTRACLRTEWLGAAKVIARDLGLRSPPPLRSVSGSGSPYLLGLVRPILVLPDGFDATDFVDREAVLRHELGHWKRGDLWVQLGVRLACAWNWWNPLFHWAGRRIRRERELACDELALRGGIAPSRYAGLLLACVREWKSAPRVLWARFSWRPELEGRIVRALGWGAPAHAERMRPWCGLTALAISLVCVLCVRLVPRSSGPEVGFSNLPSSPFVLATEWIPTSETPADRSTPSVVAPMPLSVVAVDDPTEALSVADREPDGEDSLPVSFPPATSPPEAHTTMEVAADPTPPSRPLRPKAGLKLRFVAAFVSLPLTGESWRLTKIL